MRKHLWVAQVSLLRPGNFKSDKWKWKNNQRPARTGKTKDPDIQWDSQVWKCALAGWQPLAIHVEGQPIMLPRIWLSIDSSVWVIVDNIYRE